MKFECHCGNVISDQTDFIPYKAILIADQDFFDFLQSLERGKDGAWVPYCRYAYQCNQCGRLWVNDQNQDLQPFVPENKSLSKGLLSSVKREAWRRPLIGVWESDRKPIYGKKGHLFYGNFGDDGFETIEPWGEFERRYYELFEELKSKDILRGALLRKDKSIIHTWEYEKGMPDG